MHVLIIGAGVIGVTTAWYLRQAGCEVTVLELHSGAAMETSHANAGQISPGYAAPWAAPGMPLKAMKWLLQKHGPLRVHPAGDAWQLQWMARMLAQCTAEAYQRNKSRMVPLAEYSRDMLRSLREQTGIHYEGRSLGTLQVFRKPAQLEQARRDADILASLNVAHRLLQADEVATIEPALAGVRGKLVGALHLPNDETGDCQLFTTRLALMAAEHGVKFRYGCNVLRLAAKDGAMRAIHLSGEVLKADAVVLAAGVFSRDLAHPLGVDLPVYPVKGYSITVPIENPEAAPQSTVMDETYKVALTRFDRRLRVGGMAELAGLDKTIHPGRIATLKMVAADLFAGAGNPALAQEWCGLRPMTPDGTPIIGPTAVRNLWTNTGHGTLGWTMACGSAQLLADLICGRPPAIDCSNLAADRYIRPA